MRYIDADLIPYTESENGVLDDFAYRYDINEIPTADVAPKSEVEKLHEVIFKKEDLMQKIAKERNDYYDELQYAKQKVAREIFEELETSLYYKMVNGDVTLMIRDVDYHELKKKYTGEQT